MGFHSFSPQQYTEMSKSMPMTYVDWSMSDEEVVFTTPDTAVCNYHVKQTTKGKDGKLEKSETTDTSVWAKDGKDWKCIYHYETPAAHAQRMPM